MLPAKQPEVNTAHFPESTSYETKQHNGDGVPAGHDLTCAAAKKDSILGEDGYIRYKANEGF